MTAGGTTPNSRLTTCSASHVLCGEGREAHLTDTQRRHETDDCRARRLAIPPLAVHVGDRLPTQGEISTRSLCVLPDHHLQHCARSSSSHRSCTMHSTALLLLCAPVRQTNDSQLYRSLCMCCADRWARCRAEVAARETPKGTISAVPRQARQPMPLLRGCVDVATAKGRSVWFLGARITLADGARFQECRSMGSSLRSQTRPTTLNCDDAAKSGVLLRQSERRCCGLLTAIRLPTTIGPQT